MFRFSHQGQEFTVSFARRQYTVDHLKKKGVLSKNHRTKCKSAADDFIRQCTEAVIRVKEETKFETVARGISVCSPIDAFSSSAGRKFALRNAIKNNRSSKSPLAINKNLSIKLWDEYFNKHKDGILPSGRRISASDSHKQATNKEKSRAKARAGF